MMLSVSYPALQHCLTDCYIPKKGLGCEGSNITLNGGHEKAIWVELLKC